jgi:hypothetical protein
MSICKLYKVTRFEEYNSVVTHCIVNQINEVKLKFYMDMNPEYEF